ncbi:hypothetical protein [Tautonia plasticadhaerens]|uniref:Uncharacterized protein n=1 Tax=Tautonia plasticadhaerens TaxID=2527974 RepID=A0A518HEK5_9BACT|nr:hypothetical protein [Tautonia plasticadhaerens]QDV39261.1 hypothetical protein ElP_72250 [Tautonia plasticadhaerens]
MDRHQLEGTDPPPGARVPQGWCWGMPFDYDRACGMITAFLPQAGGGMLVRWGYAEGVDQIRDALASVP